MGSADPRGTVDRAVASGPSAGHGAQMAVAQHAQERDGLPISPDDAIRVAYPHDVLENTSNTEGNLRRAGLSNAVIEMVVLLTKAEARSRYDERVAKLAASGNLGALPIRLSDAQDNRRACRTLPNSAALLRRHKDALPALQEAAAALGQSGVRSPGRSPPAVASRDARPPTGQPPARSAPAPKPSTAAVRRAGRPGRERAFRGTCAPPRREAEGPGRPTEDAILALRGAGRRTSMSAAGSRLATSASGRIRLPGRLRRQAESGRDRPRVLPERRPVLARAHAVAIFEAAREMRQASDAAAVG